MPHIGRDPAVVSRKKPTGGMLPYPICGWWACDDDEDWDTVGPDDPDYAAIKREYEIAFYHHPRNQWEARLKVERDRRSNGDPLWWGTPKR